MQHGPKGVHPVFPQTGLGGARRRGDLVSTVGGSPAGHAEHRRVSLGHCRHWHHQPAGNHRGLEQKNRPPRLSGNRLAVPPDRRVLRQPEGAGPGGAHPAEDRPGAGRLFFRHKAPVDSGADARRPDTGGARGAVLWDRGNLAHLEAHRGQTPCDGCLQCLPDHALQHPHPAMGPGNSGGAGNPPMHAAGGPVQQRGVRHDRARLVWRAHSHRRCSRGPAGRPLWSGQGRQNAPMALGAFS